MSFAYSWNFRIAAVLLSVATCSSCYHRPATYPQRTAASGALMGAGVGALIGSSRGETAAGALIGATAGALAGGIYGERRALRYGNHGYGVAYPRVGYGVHTPYPGTFYRSAIVHPSYRVQPRQVYSSGYYRNCPPYGRAYGRPNRFYY